MTKLQNRTSIDWENMDLYHLLTPAVLSYEGIAFQYVAPSVFEDSQFH